MAQEEQLSIHIEGDAEAVGSRTYKPDIVSDVTRPGCVERDRCEYQNSPKNSP
jgi:hypothetical protein